MNAVANQKTLPVVGKPEDLRRQTAIKGSHIIFAGCYYVSTAMTERFDFEIVCVSCDTIGIVFDGDENAMATTPIRCRRCGAPRGTLGELRKLAVEGIVVRADRSLSSFI